MLCRNHPIFGFISKNEPENRILCYCFFRCVVSRRARVLVVSTTTGWRPGKTRWERTSGGWLAGSLGRSSMLTLRLVVLDWLFMSRDVGVGR